MDELTSSEGSATTDGNALPNRDRPDVTRVLPSKSRPRIEIRPPQFPRLLASPCWNRNSLRASFHDFDLKVRYR